MWFTLEEGVTARELSELLALYWEMYKGYLGVDVLARPGSNRGPAPTSFFRQKLSLHGLIC